MVRRRYFGDLILMTPVFRNLKAHRPDARITLVVDERYRDVLSRHPDVDEIRGLPFRREGEARVAFARRWLAFVRGLRSRRFDVVYDLQQNDRSALVSVLSGARRRVSFVNGRERLRHRLFNPRAVWSEEERAGLHSVELHLKVLEADGVPVETTEVRLPVPDEDRRRAGERIREALDREGRADRAADAPLLVVHPGARTASKRWPPEGMAAACDVARDELGARVLLLAGPDETELLDRVRSRCRDPVPALTEEITVPELAAVLERADVFLCNDSGPMHLAAAVGTRVVALFGATDPVRWAPRGRGHRVLRPGMPCPCVVPERCRPPDPYKMWCVRRLEAREVARALARALEAV